jgi:hypothetical protein
MCLLHFNLRITGGNINKLVFANIGKYGDFKEQAAELCAILQEAGVWVIEERLKPKSKQADAAHVKDISFVGRDAVGIQTLADKLMDVVFPPEEREDDENIKSAYEKGMAVWNVWRDL